MDLLAYLDPATTSLIFVLPALIGLGLIVWAFVDMAHYSPAVWEAAGHSRRTWAILILASILCTAAWALSIAYLVIARPKLRAAEAAAAAG